MTKVAPQNPKNQLSMQNKFEVIDFKPQFQKISFPDQKYIINSLVKIAFYEPPYLCKFCL